MAEFLDVSVRQLHGTELNLDAQNDDGFAAFGKPVPMYRRDAALEHARSMGCDDTSRAFAVINSMATAIQNDQPYKAMEYGMQLVDLTGTYRLLAVLCTAEPAK
jgi:hypothetical protein